MSSKDHSPTYDDVLRELQGEFLALLPERVAELRSALTLLATDPAARSTMQRLGHRIGGTAATVGFEAVGAVGRAIEQYVAARTAWADGDVAALAGAVALLGEWTAAALDGRGRDDGALLADPRLAALLGGGDAP